MNVLQAGTTFRFEDRHNDDHLYVIISDPQQAYVVVVNLTTLRRFSDTSCVFDVGDHPFIAHPTCIAYEFAEVIETVVLQRKIHSGHVVPQAHFASDRLIRIWDGAEKTRNLPNRAAELLRQQGLIP